MDGFISPLVVGISLAALEVGAEEKGGWESDSWLLTHLGRAETASVSPRSAKCER